MASIPKPIRDWIAQFFTEKGVPESSSDVNHDQTSNRTHEGDDLSPDTLEVGAADIDREFQGALVAHPDVRSVQETLDEMGEGDTAIIRGTHNEHGIQMPALQDIRVIFLHNAKVVNENTNGEHTFIAPDSESSFRQRWVNLKAEGNADSGKGIHTPDGARFARRILINPHITDHGDVGIDAKGAVSTYIIGHGGTFGVVENNGQSLSTSCNIRLQPSGGTNGTTSNIERVEVAGCDRNIWITNGRGHAVSEILDRNNSDVGLYVEDSRDFEMRGPWWFENSTNYDAAFVNDYDLIQRQRTYVTGKIKWDEGPDLRGSHPNAVMFEDASTPYYMDDGSDALAYGGVPAKSTQPSKGMREGTSLYYRENLNEVREIGESGVSRAVGLSGWTKRYHEIDDSDRSTQSTLTADGLDDKVLWVWFRAGSGDTSQVEMWFNGDDENGSYGYSMFSPSTGDKTQFSGENTIKLSDIESRPVTGSFRIETGEDSTFSQVSDEVSSRPDVATASGDVCEWFSSSAGRITSVSISTLGNVEMAIWGYLP